MFIDFLKEIFERNKNRDAIVWRNEAYTYEWLLGRTHYWQERLIAQELRPGTVVILEADFSPNSIALFLALIEWRCVLVPLSSSVEAKRSELITIAQGEFSFAIDKNDNLVSRELSGSADHEYYEILRSRKHPGLVLFSSGSTGKTKAAVHDLLGLLEKFKISRQTFRTMMFLLYDHIGGINTMFYTFSNAGCMVTTQDRSPDSVLHLIAEYKVELLPTSPTFINLILLSEAYKRHDLSSLKVVTYGTEPMSESTLRRFHELFPQVRLLQTYGLSEVGILRSQSKSSGSLWVKVGGQGFETRIVDGILQVKAHSAMLGYLNAASPFTEDGWFDTGDSVEADGDYLKILGRKSEMINVGGEKVYPAEVESVIQEMTNVGEVTVFGEKNSILGNIVCAKVRLSRQEDQKSFALRLKKYCSERLQNYKVPVRVIVVDERLHGDRFKKVRNTENADVSI